MPTRHHLDMTGISFSFFVFTQAASAWFVVSPVQGVFRRPITPTLKGVESPRAL
jgi:hypothetical protein